MKKTALFLAVLLLLTACSKEIPASLTQAREFTSSELTALGHSGVCETYTGPYSTYYRNPDGSKTVSLYGITENWCAINSRWETLPSCDPTPAGQVKVKKKGTYSIPCTDLMKEILKGFTNEQAAHNIRNGFLITCEEPGKSLLLASGDHGLYAPCLKLTVMSTVCGSRKTT